MTWPILLLLLTTEPRVLPGPQDPLVQEQDTVTVAADNPPVWGTELLTVQDLRIGCLDGPEECTFGNISGVAVGEDGSVFIADRFGPTLKAFDPEGLFSGRIGGVGDGPGEFRRIGGMTVLASGDLAIWDHPNQRITIFRPDGEYLRSFRAENRTPSAALLSDRDGFLYLRDLRARTTAEIGGLGTDLPFVWVRYDETGALVDSIAIPLADPDGPSFFWSTPWGNRWPFTTRTVSALSPFGYLVVGRNSEYAIHRPLADGRVLRIEKGYLPLTPHAEEREEWAESQARLADLTPAGAIDSETIPKEKPPFRQLVVDSEGRIWVSRYTEAKELPASTQEEEEGIRTRWIEPSVWDVIDPRGTFLGTVAMPDRTQLVDARGKTIWAIETGDMGEEYVVRLRVEWGGGR
jgi:hypothetical protein